MGRALLITLAAVLIALSYTFIGMNSQSKAMTERNVNSHSKAMAKNTAHTGIQLAIDKYNTLKTDEIPDNEEFTNDSTSADGANLWLSVEEGTETIDGESTEIITVTSKSTYNAVEHQVVATFDVSQNQSLIPGFVSALSIANESFNFEMGGSSSISGIDASNTCSDTSGVTVPDLSGVNKVGERPGIEGNPPGVATIDNSIDFDDLSQIIDRLQPNAKHISGNYKGDLGTAENPEVIFVDNYTKLTGGIEPGYGILVIRSGGELDFEGELDVAGNFEFNGLVIFENAYKLNGRGTPNINGSVIVGYSDETANTNIDISGNIHLQYNCENKKYADDAVDKVLNTTLYQRLSIYE